MNPQAGMTSTASGVSETLDMDMKYEFLFQPQRQNAMTARQQVSYNKI